MHDLQHGAFLGELDIRARRGGGKTVKGSFPYRRRAVMSDGGRSRRPEKEEFDSRAFSYRVEKEDEEIYFLSGHRYDKPLASKLNGTLKLRDTDDALFFEADVLPEILDTQHARDAIALLTAGLATGISPGFRMPPERAVPREEAEVITQEPVNPEAGEHGASIRLIKQALLYELSLVTQPAYSDAQAEARHLCLETAPVCAVSHLNRWRL